MVSRVRPSCVRLLKKHRKVEITIRTEELAGKQAKEYVVHKFGAA